MTDEERLIEKLRKIEALFARPGTAGEREAARAARSRVRQRLDDVRSQETTELRISLPDAWARALFVALLRRHSVTPYRYPGQRRNTVMVRVPRAHFERQIWPEFEALHKTLQTYLNDVTQRVIASAVHGDVSEPELRRAPRQLTPGEPVEAG